ncbi:hypothetical protein [Zunongwangia sp. H14]|uniref:hypothetical protein n=1 Tax=Zunongwangia sp. H14 TaxID=3240792 RepID=UPI0035618318
MKKFKHVIALVAMLLMILSSCSREDSNDLTAPDNKASLSFSTLLNDLMNSSKQQAADDLPACSDDAPAYVHVVLEGEENIGSLGNPLQIPVNSTPSDEDGDGDGVAEYFTEYSDDLELSPGNYQLVYFVVYNEDNEIIWVAPTEGGELAGYVDDALPIDISLGAGVKKYVDVNVLCYDNRMVNEYGYLFFDIITNEAIEFCFFANYCTDNGRHYTANYSVDIWLGTDNTGTPLYTNLTPATGINEDGDYYAGPVCAILPSNDDEDEEYIYYELSLLDWDENYGEVTPRIVSGTLSRSDIEANFGEDDTMDYEHIQFNCIPDQEIPPGPRCLPDPTGECEQFIFIEDVDIADFSGGNPQYPVFSEDGDAVGTITFNLEVNEEGRDLLSANVQLIAGWTGTAARITLPEYLNADDVCVRNINSSNFEVVYQAGAINYPVVVRFATNICPSGL